MTIRKSPNADTYKLLYARSGNECAFKDCIHPIFNDEGLYVANLCHIEAASPNGPRYNDLQNPEQRDGVDNLLFMCHRHHKETDDVNKYSVEVLKQIKVDHEVKYSEFGRELDRSMINQIKFESNYFWNFVLNKKFDVPEYKFESQLDQTIEDLIVEIELIIERIQEYCDVIAESDSDQNLLKDINILMKLYEKDPISFDDDKYSRNPFSNRNWELHNIGRPNYFMNIYVLISQLKLRYYEIQLTSEPDNVTLKDKVETSRREFDEIYTNSYYTD